MAEKKTNHICKNKNCPNGVNGEPKHYYACNYCDRTNQWRSVACSPECYDEYIKQVLDARSKNMKVNTLPERTDMTQEEVQKLMEKPVEEVKEEVVADLSDYTDNGLTISEAIEVINEEIDAETEQVKNIELAKSKKKSKKKYNGNVE